MKSKHFAFLLLRLFSIIYFTIYSIPAINTGISILSLSVHVRFGFETTYMFLFLILSILIPIVIWFGAGYLSSMVINSNEESEIQFGLSPSSLLSVAVILLGLIYFVKSIPALITIIYSKIFIGNFSSLPSIPQSNIRIDLSSGLIQPIIELLIGLILISFNKHISRFIYEEKKEQTI